MWQTHGGKEVDVSTIALNFLKFKNLYSKTLNTHFSSIFVLNFAPNINSTATATPPAGREYVRNLLFSSETVNLFDIMNFY
jgi:hypothetical protein